MEKWLSFSKGSEVGFDQYLSGTKSRSYSNFSEIFREINSSKERDAD
jgi:hypothetical protein